MPDNTTTTAQPLYSAAQTRELDRLAMQQAGIAGYTLMTRAGEACWALIHEQWPAARGVSVFCGVGNNGGDGYIVARLALAAGYRVQLLQLGDVARLPADARQAYTDFVAAGGTVLPFAEGMALTGEVIIDALLGTGVDRPVEGRWRDAIEAINTAARPVVAVDIPSGLQADTGQVLGVAVEASHTVTFIARKRGLYTGDAVDYVGALQFADLGVPANVYLSVTATAQVQLKPALGALAQPRRRSAHKGAYGHVLVIGGEQGMAGAVRLAGEAALRCGAGRVSVATRPAHAAQITAGCPELMCHAVASADQLHALIRSAGVLLIGPGLGQSEWAHACLSAVLAAPQPRVIDADGLRLLATQAIQSDRQVLTPHPGEAAQLLGNTVAGIQADRYTSVQAMQQKYGGTIILKGAGTLTDSGSGCVSVCAAGNPGMATAGSGDVLSGVIAALIAQGLEPAAAATAGVCVHACAGDRAAAEGERGLLARDIIAALRSVMNASGAIDAT